MFIYAGKNIFIGVLIIDEKAEDTMIELGGKIFLEGFEILDQAELLITKKLVGSYVRTACDTADCQRAELTLERTKDGFRVSARTLTSDDKEVKGEGVGRNVFMTIDAAMKDVLRQAH